MITSEAADPLEGVLRKLDRAQRHLQVVNRLSHGWERYGRAQKPYSLTYSVEPTVSDPTPHPVYRFVLDQAPPVALSLVIGDCVHNLRGALDYIAWVLKRDDGRPEDEQIQFPIWLDRWHPNSPKLAGLASEACRAIDGLQPFHGPNRRRRHTHDLANLFHVSNWDKHRQLVIGGINLGITSWYGGRPIRGDTGLLAHGSIVMEFLPGQEVSTNPNMACVIVFAEPKEVRGLAPDLTLGYIHEYIRDTVIPAMRPHV